MSKTETKTKASSRLVDALVICRNTELMFWGDYCMETRDDLSIGDLAIVRNRKCKVVDNDGYNQYLRPIKDAD